MKNKAIIIQLSCILAILTVVAPAQAQSGNDKDSATVMILELDQAIQLGMSNSVDEIVADNEYVAAYWRYRTYRTELLPEVTLTGTTPYYSKSYNMLQNEDGSYRYVSNNYNRLDGGLSISQNIPWTGGKLTLSSSLERLSQNGNKASTAFSSTPFSITLEQPLFAFNRVRWLQKIEPVKFREAEKQYASDQQEVILTVIEHYFNLLLSKVNLEITRQNYANADKLYKISEARYANGQLSNVDLLQMQTSLLNAESALTDANTSFNARMFQLRSYLGMGEDIILEPVLPQTLTISPLDYRQVSAQAHANNAFTQNIQRRFLEASREVSKAKAERWNIQLFASFGWAAQEGTFPAIYNSNNWRDNQMVNVGISIPLLDWGKGKGKVRMAESSRQVELAKIEKEKMDFNQNLYLQVQKLNDQPRQVARSKRTSEIAQQRYDILVETFIQGKIDILNLNDSQTAKDNAHRNYIEQLLLLWTYYYQIRSLTLYDYITDAPLTATYPAVK